MTTAAEAAEAASRSAYGRMLSWLAWQWRDIAAAEDALAEAFAIAMQCWPRDGVPASPEGWLMTVAKRQLLQAARRHRLATDPAFTAVLEAAEEGEMSTACLQDHRLRLMLVCAHPAIDPSVRSALMLQTVLGIEAARIARAFVVTPEAMTKRLVRAKAKIKATGLRFEEPEPAELPLRVDAVLDTIYGAYTLHWNQADAAAADGLADEAVFLATLVATHLPRHAEALGLLSLLLLCQARRRARLGADGEFVPLDRQDPLLWNDAQIEQALDCLANAAALQAPGPFQLEAAIQAAHCERRLGNATPWADITVLYERLLDLHPAIGAQIGHAVASAHARGDPHAGLTLLDALRAPGIEQHQPWWAARAHLLALLPDHLDEARDSFGRALALTEEPALRRHLARRLATCESRARTSAPTTPRGTSRPPRPPSRRAPPGRR